MSIRAKMYVMQQNETGDQQSAAPFDLGADIQGGEPDAAPADDVQQDAAPEGDEQPAEGDAPPEGEEQQLQEDVPPDAAEPAAPPAAPAAPKAPAVHPVQEFIKPLVDMQQQMLKREEERAARSEAFLQEQRTKAEQAAAARAAQEQERAIEEQLQRMAPVPPPLDAGPDAQEQYRQDQAAYIAKVASVRAQQHLNKVAAPIMQRMEALEQRIQQAQVVEQQRHVESLIEQDLTTLRNTKGLEWLAQKPEAERAFVQFWAAMNADQKNTVRGPQAMSQFLAMFQQVAPLLRQHGQQARKPGAPAPAPQQRTPGQTQARPRGPAPRGNQRTSAPVQTDDWLSNIQ